MPVYRIANRSEEFDCPTCGCELTAGDSAWQDDDDSTPYCSAYCAGADPRNSNTATAAKIIGCSRLASGGYWVTFDRSDGYIYSEVWPTPPAGVHIDGY